MIMPDREGSIVVNMFKANGFCMEFSPFLVEAYNCHLLVVVNGNTVLAEDFYRVTVIFENDVPNWNLLTPDGLKANIFISFKGKIKKMRRKKLKGGRAIEITCEIC